MAPYKCGGSIADNLAADTPHTHLEGLPGILPVPDTVGMEGE